MRCALNSARGRGGARVVAAHLALKNPREYRNWEDAASADVLSLRQGGHDGFIHYHDDGSVCEIAVFDASQIRVAWSKPVSALEVDDGAGLANPVAAPRVEPVSPTVGSPEMGG